ncbi:hypothetical protein [Hymenobacter saemangeumensis]|uniref:hypothetical protein n=1 Tax=Hymenobacter saemangeumensis TaxID=1084522 RepID=UPI0031ECDA63
MGKKELGLIKIIEIQPIANATKKPALALFCLAFSNTTTLRFVPLEAEIYEEFSKNFSWPCACANYSRKGKRAAG